MYASRTGTRRNLDAMRAAGWRLMVSPTGAWRTEGFPYALDNGAWTAFNSGGEWSDPRFRLLVIRFGQTADFVVAPDIVGGGMQSFRLSESYLPWLLDHTPRALFAVQDGMTPGNVAPLLGARVGIFVGGSTEWKLATMKAWGRCARSCGAYFHVGRVNTARRILAARMAGADSVDGSSASRFAKTLAPLDKASRRPWQSSLLDLIDDAEASHGAHWEPTP